MLGDYVGELMMGGLVGVEVIWDRSLLFMGGGVCVGGLWGVICGGGWGVLVGDLIRGWFGWFWGWFGGDGGIIDVEELLLGW